MQLKRIPILILFGLGLILVAIFALPARSINPNPHMIAALQPSQPPGNIRFRRHASSSGYKPAFVGVMLADDDEILLVKEASAEIICQNTDSWKPLGGKKYKISEGCPQRSSRGFLPIDEDTGVERAINDPEIPYLITPRKTAIQPSTSELTLSWNPTTDSQSYKVELIGPGIDWTQKTSATNLIYRDTKTLKPGGRYWVIVTSDLGQDSQSEGKFGFSVLSSELEAEVKNGKTKIEGKNLSPEAEALALARFYQGYELNQDAITVLETAIDKKIESAAIYRLLGDTYRYVGLNRLARDHYLQGIDLAKITGDVESEELMQANLNITDAIIGN